MVRSMIVVDLVEAGGILLRPPCATFEEAVRSLVDSLVTQGRLRASFREAAVRAVCEREQIASTAVVEIGVSVPHARLTGVEGVMAALAASPTGLYHAMAGVPISIMALVLSGQDLAAEHLNVIAGLSILLQSHSVRHDLEHASDVRAAVAVLRA